MLKKIRISVLMTCYNEQDYVKNAILSVLSQTDLTKIIEIIIVDDGSTDNSSKVIQSISNTSNIPIRYIYQDNQGLAVARNTGINLCKGNYVALLDGDDIWDENKIEKQFEVLKNYPDVGLIYSDFSTFGTLNRRIFVNGYYYEDENVLKNLFINGGPIVPSTTLINKEVFENVGVFDPDLRMAQDTDMWLRIVKYYKIHHISESLMKRRIHSKSLSSNHDKKREYLFYLTDKIISLYPELSRYKNKRLAMLARQSAKEQTLKGNRKKALIYLYQSFNLNPFEIRLIILFLILIIPININNLKAKSISFKSMK